jgi:urate oxidase
MALLSFDTYGKTRVRLLQVLRLGGRHEVIELAVKILFQGDFGNSYITADNSRVLPTDTMKNTVYAIARQKPVESIERFGLDLGQHFLDRLPFLDSVSIEIAQTPWNRIASNSSAFLQATKERRTAHLTLSHESKAVRSGLQDLQILKTSKSAFAGYLRDEYTTLPEAHDRLLGTVLDADWTFLLTNDNRDFNTLHNQIRETLLDVFAKHESQSVQHTLYAMAEAVIERFSVLQEVHLTMPNKHCLLVDLSRFGLDNPNQIFVPTDEPSGFIEARVTR